MAAPIVATTTVSSPSSTGLMASGARTGQGLFLSMLGTHSALKISASQNNNIQMNASLSQGGTLDPSLLVLQQELANLSPAELQALLADAANATDGGLNNSILISLTPGTPAADAIADFLAQHADSTTVLSSNTVTNDMTTLTTTDTAATTDGNVLLVATGLTPSDLEQLKDVLKTLQNNAIEDAEFKDNLDDVDAIDAEAIAVALVMFSPPPAAPSTNLDSDFDILAFGSLTAGGPLSDNTDLDSYAGQLTSANQTLISTEQEKYISPFDMDDTLELGDSLYEVSPESFEGSLASLSSEKSSTSIKEKSVLGKMDVQSTLFGGSHIPSSGSLSTFNESSLLMANGQSISSAPSLTNPLINNTSAASAHPATQMVAVTVEKAVASGSTEKTLSIQLDPPELGRVQVQLSLEKGETLKVHVVAENKDTLSLLQRDSHTLRASLEQAGIQTDGTSLSFDMAGGDQSFNQLLGGSQDEGTGKSRTSFSLNADSVLSAEELSSIMDTKMDFTPDSITGNVHYSLLV